MDSVVVARLDTLEASFNALIASLTTTPSFANAPSATQELVSADDALTLALATLRRHQDNYARILTLKDEANRLQDQIRGIVRTCGELRAEIGDIHPSILETDSDDEDEQVAKQQDIDYKTLLAFAARIGKHNALAVREAEQDSIRRKIEAKKKENISRPGTNANGVTANGQAGGRDAVEMPKESQNDLNFLNSQVAAERAVEGMAFPAAEILRNGALGQLQLAREQGGDDAVDKEVERWIRDAEDVESAGGERAEESTVATAPSAGPPQPATTQPRPPHAALPPVTAPKKLKLDMWDEEDEDDDDDD